MRKLENLAKQQYIYTTSVKRSTSWGKMGTVQVGYIERSEYPEHARLKPISLNLPWEAADLILSSGYVEHSSLHHYSRKIDMNFVFSSLTSDMGTVLCKLTFTYRSRNKLAPNVHGRWKCWLSSLWRKAILQKGESGPDAQILVICMYLQVEKGNRAQNSEFMESSGQGSSFLACILTSSCAGWLANGWD